MPYQITPPKPALSDLIDAHDERLRGAEVNRIGYSGSIVGTLANITGVYSAPVGWPNLTVQLGVTGHVLVFAGATFSNTGAGFNDVGVCFDGGAPAGTSVEIGAGNTPGNSLQSFGVGGFSFAPNSVHVFTMTVRSSLSTTASNPFFVVLPIA